MRFRKQLVLLLLCIMVIVGLRPELGFQCVSIATRLGTGGVVFNQDVKNLRSVMVPGDGDALLIVTHEDFLGVLERLEAWKERTGIATTVVSWQALNATQSGVDEAERIKQGIRWYHATGQADYVMLVGDVGMFPVRYQMTDRTTNDSSMVWGYGAWFASDLYYADLYDTVGLWDSWDNSGNGLFGELHGEYFTSNPINFDAIDMIPDVAVGRVPADTIAEVNNYVNKVIAYEERGLETRSGTDWFKEVLFIIPHSPDDDLDEIYLDTKENIAANSLTIAEGFNILRLYNSAISATAAALTDGQPTTTAINNSFNAGIGFVNYGGHGNIDQWGHNYFTWNIPTTTPVSPRWPIAVSMGCGTGKYSPEPPYDSYIDMNGVSHLGIKNGELWPVVGDPTLPPPACVQVDAFDSFPETLLVRDADKGAVGYFAPVTGAQSWNRYLDEFFYQYYLPGVTMGEMWMNMTRDYCDASKSTAGHSLGSIGRGETSINAGGDWFQVAGYHQPIKFTLFGDPSLRVGGLLNRPPRATSSPLLFELDEGEAYGFNTVSWGIHDVDGQPLSFRWDFDGDYTWDTPWSSSAIRVHSYPDDRTGEMFVIATDGTYYSPRCQADIVVNNVAPEVSVRGDTTIVGGQTVYLTVDITDPGTDTFTYFWEFGEGTTPETSTVRSPEIIFAGPAEGLFATEPREYRVNVTVTDDDGGIGIARITVLAYPPSLLPPIFTGFIIAGMAAIIAFYALWQHRMRKMRPR
ncbi:MAG: C25 family cysteine peptidase [Promethearchaeota archaeon]